MDLMGAIGLLGFVTVVGFAVIGEKMGSLAASSDVRDVKSEIYSLDRDVSSLDGDVTKVHDSIEGIACKIDGLSQAVYAVEDKLSDAAVAVEVDVEGRELTIEALHQRLDNIEIFLQELSNKLDYAGLERGR